MDRKRWPACLAMVVALSAGAVSAGNATPAPRTTPAVVASAAWIRLPPPAAQVAAGYVQLRNPGGEDRLVAATAAGFGQVQIHAMRMDGERMRMQALPDGLVLPAGNVTALQPGGYHLMLMLPRRPLQDGQQVRIRLQFARSGEQTVDFLVRDGRDVQSQGHGAGR